MESNLPPSGKWCGYYLYSPKGTKYRHEMTLSFSNCIIVGSGVDKIGMFKIRGEYDPEQREANWLKTYAGRTVSYRGFYERDSIWGVWRSGGLKGGFCIWPRQIGVDWKG